MIINHNMSAYNAQRNMKINNDDVSRSMSKLSSGLRITKSADDPSGLAVSEKMRTQIRGLNQASQNASIGISLIQTTEGYLDSSTKVIQRIRELAIKAANGTYSNEDHMYMQFEVSQLVDEVDRIASSAEFNGMNLLTGRFAYEKYEYGYSTSLWLHVGANMDQRIRTYIGTMTATSLGLKQYGTGFNMSVSTQEQANRNIGILDAALKAINEQRANLGAYQNRLESSIKRLDVGAENLQAAESLIRDVNMAAESVNMTRSLILFQADTSMLAQANLRSQSVLQILQ